MARRFQLFVLFYKRFYDRCRLYKRAHAQLDIRIKKIVCLKHRIVDLKTFRDAKVFTLHLFAINGSKKCTLSARMSI